MKTHSLVPKYSELPPDFAELIQGLARGESVNSLVKSTGWTKEKVLRVSRSAEVVTALSAVMLTRLSTIVLPSAVDVLQAIVSTGRMPPEPGQAKGVSVPPKVRLDAVVLLFKTLRLEELAAEMRAPAIEDDEDMSREQLADLVDRLESIVARGGGGAHDNAPIDVEDAFDYATLPNDFSVL